MGMRSTAPATIIRDLIEIDLAKIFHWTPEQISKIPYVWIQKYYLIEKMRNSAAQNKVQVAEAHSHVSTGHGSRGGPKRFIREVR